MKKYFSLLILILYIIPSHSQENVLLIEVQQIKNNQGLVRINLFQKADGFPEDYQKALAFQTSPAELNRMIFQWDSLDTGIYAVSVVHDENENGRLDTNFFGIPKEGVGVSNNIFPTFSAPTFEDAKFNVQDTTRITIEMKY